MIWHVRHGRWWALQWCWDWWFSLGIHVDLRHRHRSDGLVYGPYVDLHLGFAVLSLGNNPIYAGDIEASCSVSRGGIR